MKGYDGDNGYQKKSKINLKVKYGVNLISWVFLKTVVMFCKSSSVNAYLDGENILFLRFHCDISIGKWAHHKVW
jgi:hypothetical protein